MVDVLAGDDHGGHLMDAKSVESGLKAHPGPAVAMVSCRSSYSAAWARANTCTTGSTTFMKRSRNATLRRWASSIGLRETSCA